jgi:hypothetical protein
MELERRDAGVERWKYGGIEIWSSANTLQA